MSRRISTARNEAPWAPSRRDFLKAAGLTAAQMNLVWSSAVAKDQPAKLPKSRSGQRPLNVLLIVNDQERFFDKLPPNYRLPGKERLQEWGTEFTNQQIASCVCTSSRSNIYTGQHIQQTRMFDNLNFPWVQNLSTKIPTVGHLMRELGYYSAYQGKFHLNRELEENPNPPQLIGRKVMEDYGFSDYTGIGDSIGLTLGGYLNDAWIAAFSNRWLKNRGQKLNANGTPWFLAVNFVNPHDVMFYNTDVPGEKVQEQPGVLGQLAREPNYGLYQQKWDFELPQSRKQPWDEKNRPRAHFDYQKSRSALVGDFPNEDARWRRLMDYYLNCIQDVDRHIYSVLEEVKALGMLENTIIIRTSDHGELAGGHGMHGKGATAYREQNQVPMHIVHPDVKGGRKCSALTSHIDLVPTILSMAGGEETKKADLVGNLKGKDFSSLLNNPQSASVNAIRKATLYNFNMLVYADPDFTLGVAKVVAEKGKQEGLKEVRRLGLKPDLKKHRGAIRSVFDGRYKFSRYFAPLQHNQPHTYEELTSVNDLELFDHQTDSQEMVNLAADPVKNKKLILEMNAKLNEIIKEEVGVDDGQSMGLKQSTRFEFTKVDI